jgi:hypothetical protein
MITIEEAKEFLKQNGYYVDNLWHIDDIQQNYDLSDDDAYDVLGRAMQSEYIMSEIFETIDQVVEEEINL